MKKQPKPSLLSAPANLLWELIQIPSFSREEKAATDFLQQHLENLGETVLRKGNNLWLKSKNFNEEKPTLLLTAHIDTVKPVAGWTRDPFMPTIEEGKLYGLGSNDDGASLVALLEVYLQLTQTTQPYNLIFAVTCEEEISGKNGIESLIHELPKIDFAIVGEPTKMQLAVAEKGLMVLDVTAFGKAAHAARNEGENAIYKALEDISWFKNHSFDKKSDLLGAVKMTVTQINAGTQHNVVPDRCSFVVDVRTNECYSNETLLNEIKLHVKSEISARSTRLNSTATPLRHPLVQKALELGSVAFGSPTLSDQALMPFASVKIGPGDSARSHTADEYILLKEIDQAVTFYVQLLNNIKI